ncbi:NRDE-2, necessary for RNA interference-domain-containing protein [Diplogelasinospora grovesii]|uniref:NRDE-2, necessary for RNA interference-domain-containing protein n=1 Tax=Diplogelasinospora grovesii TaxID=303347 RepID=A0AAN6N6W5_9PEZI|nr:NRDE-2, necessary for RNA interference-domain-containing protein [Diplogelasinospora grovesii]
MTAFTHGDVKRFITDKLHSLAETLQAGASEEVCGQVVYVFLRLTRFLFDAGYSELAVAAWQAILELAFSRPTTEEYTDAQSAMSSFADFWESEVPRIGEGGAKGWRHFVDEGMSDPPDPKKNTKTTLPETRDQFKAWALMERQAMDSACMPARTLDDDGQDDPFRVVMFSDIKDFLVWFPSSALPVVKNQLLDAYLLFCRLPTASLSSSAWSNDPFITPTGKPIPYQQRLGSEIVTEKKTPDFGQTYGGNVALSQELLFNSGNWFRVLDKWTTMFRADDPQVPILSWVLHTLRFLVYECKVEAMADYYLALDWLNSNSNDPATAKKKTAKALLKQYSSNLRLYNAYALMEFASGNIDMAIKVLSSATSLPSDSGRQQLWNTWTWIHLESNQPQLALVRLCSSVDAGVTTITSAVLLKVRSRFETVRDYSLSSLQLETAVEYAESLALLDYLTSSSSSSSSETATENGAQGCIGAAMERILQVSGEFQSRKDLAKSEHHERLLQVAARLLYFHATHGPYRPAFLRAQFRSFVTLFPQNIMFLELYSWSETTTLRVDEPVRFTLEAISLTEPYDCVAVRRFAIAHEATTRGTVHSTKAAFESAVGSDACEGNVGLWVEYLRFCAHQIQMQMQTTRTQTQKGRDERREKRDDDKVVKMAKDVYYRALAACPWSKQLYLEGFRDSLARECGSAELRGVYHTFAVEKGLRVHVDL